MGPACALLGPSARTPGSGIGAVGDVCDAVILTLNLRRHSELGTPGEFGVLWVGIVSYRFGILVARLPPQSQRRKPPQEPQTTTNVHQAALRHRYLTSA
jgi:hypothetical protein